MEAVGVLDAEAQACRRVLAYSADADRPDEAEHRGGVPEQKQLFARDGREVREDTSIWWKGREEAQGEDTGQAVFSFPEGRSKQDREDSFGAHTWRLRVAI